jgi:hypothetical protein
MLNILLYIQSERYLQLFSFTQAQVKILKVEELALKTGLLFFSNSNTSTTDLENDRTG